MRTEAFAWESVTSSRNQSHGLGVETLLSFFTLRGPEPEALLEESGSFAFEGEASGAFLFEEEVTVFADFKDAALAGDEGDFLVGHGFDFSRHPVGFREVVSLGAVFNLDHGGEKMGDFGDLANEKLWRGEEGGVVFMRALAE